MKFLKLRHSIILAALLPLVSQAQDNFYQEILPSQITFKDFNGETLVITPKGSHVLKLENGGERPKVWNYSRYETDVLDFQTHLRSSDYKTRSEIRLRGADIHFKDASTDQTYYSSFEFYAPSNYDQLPLSDWNIIWQCAQIGADSTHYVRNTSPPLNIQMLNQRLYLTLIHDYRLQYYGNPGYSEWRRGNEVADGVPLSRKQLWAGYIKKNTWNKVFMAFKMGRNGRVRVWMNDQQTIDHRQPIGYQTADDPWESDPIEWNGGMLIKKRCSVRFGLYQGHGSTTSKSEYRSKILFKSFKIGTNWSQVKY